MSFHSLLRAARVPVAQARTVALSAPYFEFKIYTNPPAFLRPRSFELLLKQFAFW